MTKDKLHVVFNLHLRGDKRCPVCIRGYPKTCHCGGLVHGAANVNVAPRILVQCEGCDKEVRVVECPTKDSK